MANLIFFFECIAKYPELGDLFEEDIQELLGVRRSKPQEQIYGYILSKLLSSVLFVQTKKDKDDDFRLIINNVLQQIVQNKARQSLSDIFKTQRACQAVSDDFDRAIAWTGMLAYDVRIEDKEPSRTLDFDGEKLLRLDS